MTTVKLIAHGKEAFWRQYTEFTIEISTPDQLAFTFDFGLSLVDAEGLMTVYESSIENDDSYGRYLSGDFCQTLFFVDEGVVNLELDNGRLTLSNDLSATFIEQIKTVVSDWKANPEKYPVNNSPKSWWE